MVSKQMEDYVSEAREKGFPDSDIRAALLGVGWKPEEVEEILKLKDNSLPETNVEKQKKFSGKIAATGITVMLIAGIVAGGVMSSNRQLKPVTGTVKGEKISIVPTAILKPTTIPPASNIGYYASSVDDIAFKHYTDWQVETKNKMTIVSSEETRNSELYTQFGFGDVVISTVPLNSQNTDKTAYDLAIKLAGSERAEKTQINGMTGYVAVFADKESTSLDIVVIGKSKMLVVQFPYVNKLTNLSAGQSLVLESLAEVQ